MHVYPEKNNQFFKKSGWAVLVVTWNTWPINDSKVNELLYIKHFSVDALYRLYKLQHILMINGSMKVINHTVRYIHVYYKGSTRVSTKVLKNCKGCQQDINVIELQT